MSPRNTTQGEDEAIRRVLRDHDEDEILTMKETIYRLDSVIEEQRKRIIELEEQVSRSFI